MSNKKMLDKISRFIKAYHNTKDIDEFDQVKLNKLINQDWFQRLFARFEATGNDAYQVTAAYKKYIQEHQEFIATKDGKKVENLYFKYANKCWSVHNELKLVIQNILDDSKEGNL